MKIFINPGHGGTDPGAVSKSGLKEKDVSKRICDILSGLLKKRGHSVMEYQQQKSFTEISYQENISGADLFISVHCNSFSNETANGIETLYYPTSNKGKKLAECVQKSLVNKLNLTDRGIKARNDLHVLKRTLSPAILVECAFISNAKEEELLRNSPELFAEGICSGIEKYLV